MRSSERGRPAQTAPLRAPLASEPFLALAAIAAAGIAAACWGAANEPVIPTGPLPEVSTELREALRELDSADGDWPDQRVRLRSAFRDEPVAAAGLELRIGILRDRGLRLGRGELVLDRHGESGAINAVFQTGPRRATPAEITAAHRAARNAVASIEPSMLQGLVSETDDTASTLVGRVASSTNVVPTFLALRTAGVDPAAAFLVVYRDRHRACAPLIDGVDRDLLDGIARIARLESTPTGLPVVAVGALQSLAALPSQGHWPVRENRGALADLWDRVRDVPVEEGLRLRGLPTSDDELLREVAPLDGESPDGALVAVMESFPRDADAIARALSVRHADDPRIPYRMRWSAQPGDAARWRELLDLPRPPARLRVLTIDASRRDETTVALDESTWTRVLATWGGPDCMTPGVPFAPEPGCILVGLAGSRAMRDPPAVQLRSVSYVRPSSDRFPNCDLAVQVDPATLRIRPVVRASAHAGWVAWIEDATEAPLPADEAIDTALHSDPHYADEIAQLRADPPTSAERLSAGLDRIDLALVLATVLLPLLLARNRPAVAAVWATLCLVGAITYYAGLATGLAGYAGAATALALIARRGSRWAGVAAAAFGVAAITSALAEPSADDAWTVIYCAAAFVGVLCLAPAASEIAPRPAEPDAALPPRRARTRAPAVTSILAALTGATVVIGLTLLLGFHRPGATASPSEGAMILIGAAAIGLALSTLPWRLGGRSSIVLRPFPLVATVGYGAPTAAVLVFAAAYPETLHELGPPHGGRPERVDLVLVLAGIAASWLAVRLVAAAIWAGVRTRADQMQLQR